MNSLSVRVTPEARSGRPTPSATLSVHWPVKKKGYILEYQSMFQKGSRERQTQGV